MSLVDEPRDIRKGEELDVKTIEEFLKDSIPGLEGSINIKQFPSGSSNLTYSIKIGASELILRRPPHGKKAKSAHDMGREYRILNALRPVFPYCPKPLVYTEDSSIIGCPFYVMERIKGIIPRKEFPEDMDVTPDLARSICGKFVDVWAELHSIDYKEIGLEDFGKPEGYVRRQIEGWNKRYRDARTPDAPDCERIMDWLEKNMPEDFPRPSIIHNDFKLDNVVLDPANPLNIIGILDWEMATIGDPWMDLGSGLAYWIESGDSENLKNLRMLPTSREGMLTRKELVKLYSEKTGRSIDSFDFYYCYGLFRLIVIIQQIYYRYYHKQTSDERFKFYIIGVQILEEAARQYTG